MVIYKQEDLNSISFELKNFKAAIVPTDTVAGIICLDPKVIYSLKKRSKSKKLITFVCNLNQIGEINESFKKLADKFWPGQLTLIYKKVSYRMPNNKFLLSLISRVGKIYSSSANISGLNPITSIDDVNKQFGNFQKNLIFVEANYSQSAIPSTIYNIDKDKIEREGEISYEQIKQCIEN